MNDILPHAFRAVCHDIAEPGIEVAAVALADELEGVEKGTGEQAAVAGEPLAPSLLIALLAAMPAVRRCAVLVGVILVVTGLAFSRLSALVLTPAFNDVMSPKAAGEEMRQYATQGYALATCGVPTGTYNYYARSGVIPDVDAADLPAFLQKNPRAVVAIRETTLEEIRDTLPEVQVTAEHRLELKPHCLIVGSE